MKYYKRENQYEKGNKESAKPRIRKRLSEVYLREALQRSGKDALLLFENTFKDSNEKIKVRLQAAEKWSNFVFLQPKFNEYSKDDDDKSVMSFVTDLANDLVKEGVPLDILKVLFNSVEKRKEELEKSEDSEVEDESFPEESGEDE